MGHIFILKYLGTVLSPEIRKEKGEKSKE